MNKCIGLSDTEECENLTDLRICDDCVEELLGDHRRQLEDKARKIGWSPRL